MKRAHLIAVLVGIVAISVFAADAAAFYHPGMGRFTSRDPLATGAAGIDSSGETVSSEFIPRDDVSGLAHSHGSISVTECGGGARVMSLEPSTRPPGSIPWAGKSQTRPLATWTASLTDEPSDMPRAGEQVIYGKHGQVIGSVRNESPVHTWARSRTETSFDQSYPDGPNLYQYCRSEPLGRVDPSGLGSARCRVVLTNAATGIRYTTFTFFVPGFCGSQLEASRCCDAVAPLVANCYPPGSSYIPTYGICYAQGQGAFTICILLL